MLQNSICEICNVSLNIYNFANIFNTCFYMADTVSHDESRFTNY